MTETIKLYDRDAYATEFDAVVLSCEAMDDGAVYRIVLDQTLFFPEEGGQTPDRGELAGEPVLDVQIKQGIVYHKLAKPLVPGTAVHGKIDWTHRFYNMQQHSGEHIFSGLVHRAYGYDNVGFHLSNQIVTMDFNGVLSEAQAEELERKVNEIIVKNLPIQTGYPTAEELAVLEYRSKIELDGPVRIVTIPEVDACACCAPHVARTGEIGMFKIMNMQSYKGGVRISFLCGFRALADYRQRIQVISELSAGLSAGQEMLVMAVEKLKNANQELKYKLTGEKQRYLTEKIAAIPKEQEHVLLFEEDLEPLVVRNAVNQLTAEHTGICAVFTAAGENGYQFILASAAQDVREIMKEMKEKLGARGGGSAAMVQGSVQATQAQLLDLLRKAE
ncbi:MAG: hypothetical protein IJY09_05225 [Lachnospiraceae bacterium]|nr:hypothetical protein [Lachnospiraceae bacterium]